MTSPPADHIPQDYYHGGKYNFLRWAGFNLTQAADSTNLRVQQFYTNATIVEPFKNYIRALLTHVNRHTGLSYAEDPTIFAYETGNELCGPVWGDMDVPVAWLREIGAFVKALAPRKLLVDGTYGVNATHLSVEEVDIFSDHYYPVSLSKLRTDLDLGEPRLLCCPMFLCGQSQNRKCELTWRIPQWHRSTRPTSPESTTGSAARRQRATRL